jgi:ABC-type multidrug transport system ATPase subunit
MMNNYSIILNNCGKKFNREWIFRRLNYQFDIGKAYAITGHNGSGKSTLLQCIAGNMNFNEGNMQLPVDVEKHFQHLSICTPYLELIEEMSGAEFLAFHSSFKPLTKHKTIDEILLQVGLSKAANKQISKYSSGMKQRLKLAQAIFSDTPLLLLDEPCTNLDKEGYGLYQNLIQENCTNKIVIICSNEEAEIHFCNARIHINDYK